MPTFKELQQEVAGKSFRLTIIEHLVQHLDQTFCTDGPGKMVMQTDDGHPVPAWALEKVTESLLAEAKALDEDIKAMMESEIQEKTPEDPAPKKTKKTQS